MQGFQDKGDKVEFSGPLLSQTHRVDELLERHERQIRRAVRKSWFHRGIVTILMITFSTATLVLIAIDSSILSFLFLLNSLWN